MVEKDNYPGLPKELRKFNYRILDSGRCLTIVPKCLLGKAIKDGNWSLYEVPCPVSYVLEKGCYIDNGFLICDVPYDDMGLSVPDEYYDYSE